ncbi:MAG TPA: AarF/ABC1/UbiB kinase family protein [Verrucomicrobiae bacterium]|jgi:predicted unusual protein kinase regulating ubiquinone biosynthesis (AarF/ABC1/UbiB family)|nr:AarF/ABC1/UbiB kinase family protein [Verrucomicrobiae bacterium]
MVKHPIQGALRRAARLAQLGAGLAGSYLAQQLQRPFIGEARARASRQKNGLKNAKRVRQELQHLRGPVMKLGQALSMQTHFLGPEIIEELSALQMHAPSMHPTLMRAQFKSALGKYPEDVFRSFDPEPFAAASLGQVHWAVTKDGGEVAVKIQYPAMREAIESDFRTLRTAGFAALLSGHLPPSVVKEAQRGIVEETDYLREAKNLEFFGKALEPLKFVRVPKVYPELSSDRVLTMSRIPGLRLQDFLKTHPSQELRDQLGTGLTRLFFFQLFCVQALHADPHPGNYLLNRDGTIGLVDFGCVKFLKPEVIRCYAQFWSREWVHDPQMYAEIIHVIFGPRVSPADPRVRRCMNEIRTFYDEFHPLDQTSDPLDLADARFMDGLAKLAKVLVKNKFLSPEFLFLSRTESGMCNLLNTLKSRVTTTRIAREWMPSFEKPKARRATGAKKSD